jgi:hypothetical protein
LNPHLDIIRKHHRGPAVADDVVHVELKRRALLKPTARP